MWHFRRCLGARVHAHLQVVVLAHALVAGGFYPEEVPEVDLNEVAVLRGDDPGAGAGRALRKLFLLNEKFILYEFCHRV